MGWRADGQRTLKEGLSSEDCVKCHHGDDRGKFHNKPLSYDEKDQLLKKKCSGR